MENDLIELLEDKGNAIEMIFKSRIPYLANGTTEDSDVIDKISIGDHRITGYNGLCRENVSQETMDKIKHSIVEILKNEKQ